MSLLWRPALQESIDGNPLATKIPELFTEFPYDRLPEDRPGLAFFLRPEVTYGLIILYIFSDRPIDMIKNAVGLDPKSKIFRLLIAIHNFALAVFSAVVAWNAWPIVMMHLYDRGFLAIYCDKDGSLWESGFGAWAIIFYLSKFYEFIDTWILVLKGKPASFLQVYHHAGIVFTMYGGVASQAAWLIVVVLLNSVIHTLMYAYFLLKTVAPTVEIKQARYLTMAQIAQFIIGILSTIGVLVMGSTCDTESSIFSLACLHIYGLGLIALFVSFAGQKYKKS